MARSRSKSTRGTERRRRRPPNWLMVMVALAIVGGLYWYQGPADSPWKTLKARPSPKSATHASPSDVPGEPTTDSESMATPDKNGGDASPTMDGGKPDGESTSAEAPADSRGAGPAATAPPKKSSPIVTGVKIRDLSGQVVYEGEVDLRETLKRIDAGSRLGFPNDGAVFQNREKRLPKRPGDYYREWVHRTPELSGPGPQRVVTGSQGEAYYTPDHYATFRRIR